MMCVRPSSGSGSIVSKSSLSSASPSCVVSASASSTAAPSEMAPSTKPSHARLPIDASFSPPRWSNCSAISSGVASPKYFDRSPSSWYTIEPHSALDTPAVSQSVAPPPPISRKSPCSSFHPSGVQSDDLRRTANSFVSLAMRDAGSMLLPSAA